ncbi:MAG TPA: PD-(D/E)XK nuclease family protein, partial [Candidatus Aminicenantes bacterium]|nr:PD-(D/E)XK nuclease family protein [Candidatus Aminicenantes bacterium]
AAAHLPLSRGAVRIRRWVTEHRLTAFLAADRERVGKSPERVRLQNLEWSVARWVTWDPARPPIHCQGRIDRLERCGDRLTVIDYKTGAGRTTAVRPGTANMTGLARLDEAAYRQAMRAFARRFPGIQIISYLWLLEKDAGPDPQGLFAYVGERQRQFHSVWPGKSDGEERAALAGEFVIALRELAADLFLRPTFLPIPGRACDTCPFTLSCGDG